MKSAVGQVWYWPNTDEVLLLLAISEKDGFFGKWYDTLDLVTGDVCCDLGRSIETDDRWERWA